MSWLLEPSPKWFPYFGNQRRFVPYVLELLTGLGVKFGDTFHETCAGSHAISYHVARKFGMAVVANDPGTYSNAIGRCIYGHGSAWDEDLVVKTAKEMDDNYLLTSVRGEKESPVTKEWMRSLVYKPMVGQVSSLDLTDFVEGGAGGTFVYIDLPWPWRTGEATEQYRVSSGRDVPDATTILSLVNRVVSAAKRKFKYTILSNQSSNYPTPVVLEDELRKMRHEVFVARRLTVPAEHVDDLGRDKTFTEYQYVFKGV